MRNGSPATTTPWAAALALAAVLTALRAAAVFHTPLELYPDEAQYWLWSRELAWGYFSKPPMIAWLIAGTTALGSDEEGWIRLGAVLAHGLAPLALYGAGARLYCGWTGFWAAAIYSLMPGVQLSAAVMTTDAPMLLFLSAALWAYAELLRAESGRARSWAAVGLGAACGLALLSKYAGLYFILGLALHAALDPKARARWSWRTLAAAVAATALVLAPNIVWNATNRFATLGHTAANANWRDGELFNPLSAAEFLVEQLGVFGVVPLLVLLVGGVVGAVRRRLPSEDLGLLCLTAAPLAVVTVQAFISRANANWAVAAYAPGAVLVAAWLVRRRARWALGAAAVSQGLFAAAFLLAAVSPAVTSALELDNAVKRARGWKALSRVVTARAQAVRPTAVSVDDRFLFNALAYYGREFWARPDAPPLRMWVREAHPQNQAEAEAPLVPAQSGRVLHVSLTPEYAGEASRDFAGWRPLGTASVRLDPERTRHAQMFEASGYRRAPRDQVTGRPKAP